MNELFETLRAERKKVWLFAGIAAVIIVAALLINILVMPGALVAAVLGLPFAFIAIKKHKKFALMYKDGVVKTALNEVFDNLTFEPNDGISERTVSSTGMMRTGDRFSSNDLISGNYHGVGFTQSDIHIEDEDTDSDGNTTTVTVFRGRWMIFDFNKEFKSDMQVISKRFSGSTRKGGLFSKKENRLNKIELENEEFNKEFKVFAQSQEEAFYILTPHIMEALLKLRRDYKSPLMLMFVNGTLHIAVQNNKDSFEPSFFGKLDPENEKQKVLSDIGVITSFVDEMAMDRDIYKS